MNDVTRILAAIEQGDQRAADELFPLVYRELHQLAAAKMARESETQTLQPTALVHEAWLRLTGPTQGAWQNRRHFFSAAAEAMRRILIERARRRARLKHGAGQAHVDIAEMELSTEAPDDRLLAINEALAGFEKEDPEKARVVLLKFFGGFTNAQVAETLGVTERTIERQWAFAKVWLLRAMRDES